MVKQRAILSTEDHARVRGAVEEAERLCGAEFVVVAAHSSGRYDRSEDIFGLALGFVALIAVSVARQGELAPGSWDTMLRVPIGLAWALAIISAGAIAGTLLATRFPVLARPFRTRAEMEAEVHRRGTDCFTEFRVRETGGGTGVLIYVSLIERMVWVSADDAVLKKVDSAVWERVRDVAVDGIRRGEAGAGLSAAVLEAARGLAEVMPPIEGRANRMADGVREIW